MDDRKEQIRALAQHLRDTHVRFDVAVENADFAPVADSLEEFEVNATSPCGNVGVFMSGAGNLVDVMIRDDALDRIDADRMGRLMTNAMNTARGIVRDGVSAVARTQSNGG